MAKLRQWVNIIFDLDQKLLFGADSAQSFLGNTQIGSYHPEGNAVVNVCIGFTKVLVFFLSTGKSQRSDPLQQMPQGAAHRKPCVAFHFRKMVEKVTKVMELEFKSQGRFNGVDAVDVQLLLHKTTGRVDPLPFCAEVFADFFFFFQIIGAEQPFLNKIAGLADFVGGMHEVSFVEMDDADALGQFVFQA